MNEWHRIAAENCQRNELVTEWYGQTLWISGHYNLAIDTWLQLPDPYVYLEGKVYSSRHREDEEQRLMILEVLLPNHVDELATYRVRRAYKLLDQIYINRHDVENTLRVRQEMIDADPYLASNWIRLGSALHNNGEFEQAAEILNHGILLIDEKNNPFLMGWAYSILGDSQAAIQDYSEAITSYETALRWYTISKKATDEQKLYIRRKISEWQTLQ